MINFRYKIIEKLGEGGSGVVYLAEDILKQNRRCALKVLHARDQHGNDDDEMFRNEISILVNFNHPNIVRILDFGSVRHSDPPELVGRRFFTMEYIKGVDSLALIEGIKDQPERVRLLESLLLQSLSVLSYLHHDGVIHFDIKPQNLMVVGQQGETMPVLKLTDFGFSEKQDTSEEISLRGTLEYTAPELLSGQAGDHRVDLYSLGATFFHLLESRCPFEATEPVELVKRVLSDEALFSASIDPVYSRLRETIDVLLRKNPAQRFQSAREAAEGLLADATDASVFKFSPRIKFVGRSSEKAQIEAAIGGLKDGVSQETSRSIIISGDDGIGKTDLVKEMAKYARSQDLLVIEVEPVRSDIPFNAIVPVISLLQCETQSYSDEGRGLNDRYASVLKSVMPHRGNLGESESKEWEREQERLIELVSRYIIQAAEIFPFVIVADDVHVIDAQSQRVISTVVRDAREDGILSLAVKAPESSEDLFTSFHSEIHLKELDSESVLEMVQSVFGHSDPSKELGSKIFQLYGGTPAVVVEALRTLEDIVPSDVLRDVQEAKEYAASLELKLPTTVEEFLVDRYQKLNQESQLILGLLSCIQNPAPIDVIGAVLPFQRVRVLEHLGFLEFEGYLSSTENGQRVSMRLAKLKSVVYNSIAMDRMELHGLIASAMEERSFSSSFADLQELGFQFSASGNLDKAASYYEKSADEGQKLFALHRSIELYKEAAEVAMKNGDTQKEFSVRNKLSNALFRAGSYQEAVDMSKQLLAHEQGIKPPSLSKTVGLALSRLGEFDPAKEHITEALKQLTDEAEQIELRQELVGIEISTGHFKDAEQACFGQLEQARKLADDSLEATIYTDLGIATFLQNRFEDSVGYFRESLGRYEKMNNHTRIADTMINIGNATNAKGEVGRAIEYWEQALQTSKAYGTLHQQAQIQNNLGIAHYDLKQFEKAKRFYEEARDIFKRINSKNGLAYALTNLGEVSFAEGDYETALSSWSEARDLYGSMRDARGLAETFLQIAQVMLILGDLTLMESFLTEAQQQIGANSLDSFQPQLYYLCGILRSRQGNQQQAISMLTKACKSYAASGEKRKSCLCTVRLAECYHLENKPDAAVKTLSDVLSDEREKSDPYVTAEANYLLGTIAGIAPDIVAEKPIAYFRSGIEAIARQPVAEISWKLSFALAREFFERGLTDRAKQYLVKTRLVLQFFLSHFKSSELREKYLSTDSKRDVLETIDRLTQESRTQ